jgi:flagellin-like hook-associated protein FlgL
MRSNLTVLQQMNKMMDTTQTRLSTGKKVNTALDDPVNFFKAKSHADRASDLSAKKDSMKEAIQSIEAANTGIEGIYDLLDQMKSLAQAARTADSGSIDTLKGQYNELISQISKMATDSAYGGTNLLAGDELKVEFNEDGSNALTVTGFDASSANAIDTDKTLTDATFADDTNISLCITEIDDAVSYLRSQAQSLASNLSTIQIRADFTDNMINTLNTGSDNLTLADMNEEGANMLMLQTRQQLGTTALSMSSQAAQSVLQLF